MEARLEFNGMQYRLNSYMEDSIEGYREREKSLEKIEELSRKDAWAVAMEIKLMPSREAKLWHHSCRERYGFDVERWLLEGSMDSSLLTQGLSLRDATLMVTHVLSYAHWKCVRVFTSATEKAAIDLRLDKDRAICDIYVG